MRKGKKGRKLGRTRDIRRTLLRDLARALIAHERISTTEAKAKELRPFIERWVTKARSSERKGNVAVRRNIARYFGSDMVKKLVDEIAPRYAGRPGGYTRIVKRAPRTGDSAPRAFIEFVGQNNTQQHEKTTTDNEK